MYISNRMDLRYKLHIPVLLIVIVVFTIPSLALRCKRCSMDECTMGLDMEVECLPYHTDCATSILRTNVGHLRANTVFERYCYFANRKNKLYQRNTPHCQKNDKATVEVCVCQGDLCNEALPPCRLRNYGRGRTCKAD